MLSVAMIVKNEIDHLPKCLATLPRGAELVIVDTGSTDGTTAYANYQTPWEDNFAKARNFALARCRGTWVLSIDADERLHTFEPPPEMLGPHVEPDAYYVTIRNYLAHENYTCFGQAAKKDERGYYVDFKAIRFFRPYLRFSGAIHEIIEPSARKVADLSDYIRIDHLGKYDVAKERQKEELYFEMALKEAETSPSKQSYFNLMQQADILKKWDTVLWCACEQIQMDHDVVLAPTIVAGAKALQHFQQHEKALEWLDKMPSPDANTHNLRALSLAALGQLNEAAAALEASIKASPGWSLPYLALGQFLVNLGLKLEALAVWEAGHEATGNPEFLRLSDELTQQAQP